MRMMMVIRKIEMGGQLSAFQGIQANCERATQWRSRINKPKNSPIQLKAVLVIDHGRLDSEKCPDDEILQQGA